MVKGSVKAGFQFHSYHMTKFNFYTDPSVGRPPDYWNFNFNILQPAYSTKGKNYICGVSVRGSTSERQQNTVDRGAFNIEAEIVGNFIVERQIQSKELEEKLVKIQGPALLLPYLRATITSYFANAGFGAVILPLINIHELAEQRLKGVEIHILD